MLRTVQVTNTTGGTEVFVDADGNEVELLVEGGRKFAMDEARRKGFMVNSISSEFGPYPVEISTAKVCESAEMLKAAADRNDLVYRKKFILTFVGG